MLWYILNTETEHYFPRIYQGTQCHRDRSGICNTKQAPFLSCLYKDKGYIKWLKRSSQYLNFKCSKVNHLHLNSTFEVVLITQSTLEDKSAFSNLFTCNWLGLGDERGRASLPHQRQLRSAGGVQNEWWMKWLSSVMETWFWRKSTFLLKALICMAEVVWSTLLQDPESFGFYLRTGRLSGKQKARNPWQSGRDCVMLI